MYRYIYVTVVKTILRIKFLEVVKVSPHAFVGRVAGLNCFAVEISLVHIPII